MRLLAQLVSLSSPLKDLGPAILPPELTDEAAMLNLSDAHSQALENALLPVLLWQAAARDDSSLASVLDYLYQADPAGLSPPSYTSGFINQPSPTLSQTALHLATVDNRNSNASLLLSLGASVHVRDALGHTPLFYAARSGNVELVDMLVGAGAHLAQGEKESGDVVAAWSEAHKKGDQGVLEAWRRAGFEPGR
jgi:lysophospholipase